VAAAPLHLVFCPPHQLNISLSSSPLPPFVSCNSKLASDTLRDGITFVLDKAKAKPRKFTETIELQIGLKQYDPQKDKRFNGTVSLPTIPRPTLKMCMLGDAKHCEEAQGVGIDHMDVEVGECTRRVGTFFWLELFLAKESLPGVSSWCF
jgi:hypothetical protein